MKDIDFDELDKAVSSLMSKGSHNDLAVAKKPQKADPAPQPKNDEPPLEKAEADAPEAHQELLTATTEPPKQPVSTDRPAAPAQRRSGRFMDMVRTPADLKPRQPRTMASQAAPAPRPVETPAQPVQDVPQPEPSPIVTNDLPDLIKTTTPEAGNEVPSQPVQPVDGLQIPEPPIESPFLQGTKVVKRPLNPGTADKEAAPLLEDKANPVDSEPVIAQDEAETPRPVVPAELESDLVAIEASDLKKDSDKVTSPVATQNMTPDLAPVGPASIAQQYREQPSSGDQSHAAIYDASQLSAPLLHPAKKKAGWLWIVWVLLLLAVGAGGAIALYVAGLI